MSAPPAKQWGTTPAISQSFPTESELASNDALIAELKRQNNFEGVEETEKRSVNYGLNYVGGLIICVQEANATADSEDRRGICQACQQKQKSSSIFNRYRGRQDFHIWELPTWCLWTWSVHTLICPFSIH